MPFNIKTFKSNIQSKGILKNSLYEVIVTPPQILNQNQLLTGNQTLSNQSLTNDIKFRTTNVNLPGYDIKTVNIRRYGVGPIQKYPSTNEFSELSFSILCDKDSNIWKFWHEWCRLVFHGQGSSDTSNPNGINTTAKYFSHFRDEYSSTLQINIYEQAGNESIKYIFNSAYPASISGVPLNWNPTNGLIQLTILIIYKDYSVENLSTSNLPVQQ